MCRQQACSIVEEGCYPKENLTDSRRAYGLSPRRMRRRGGYFFTPRNRGFAFFVPGRSLKLFENPARCEEDIRESAENRGAQVSFALNSEEELSLVSI